MTDGQEKDSMNGSETNQIIGPKSRQVWWFTDPSMRPAATQWANHFLILDNVNLELSKIQHIMLPATWVPPLVDDGDHRPPNLC